MRLEAMLVDVGGTLVRDETWIPMAEYRRRIGARVADLYGGARPEWIDDLLQIQHTVEDAPEYVHRVADQVAAFLRERGYRASPEEVERLCRACALPLPEVVEVESDARTMLEETRRLGLRVAICSNTLWRNDEDSRRDWVEFGMGDLIDAYVTSNGTGYAKPHRRIFERALDLLDTAPERAVMLGDQLARDVAGAQAIGMRAVWKRPATHAGPVHPEPDAVVTGLSEVAPILHRWMREGS